MNTLSPSLQSVLDNRLRYLPEITGKAINSIDWSSKLITIGKKYGLHIDEMEEFQGAVLKSMIGLVPPEKFESELTSTLALSPVDVEKIIHEINDTIFEPIHDYIVHQGAPRDELKKTGIIIEPAITPTVAPVSENSFEVTDTITTNTPLEIPASPEPVVPPRTTSATRPVVSGSFDNFFQA